MMLQKALARAKTEEDVKDAYINALGLKAFHKGLVDIQTEEMWFEAKDAPTPPIIMFGQLLIYVRAAQKRGEQIPGFLAVMDREKAAIIPTEKAFPLFEDKSIKWPKSGSQAGKDLAKQIAPYIAAHFVVYDIATHEKEMITAFKSSITSGTIIRTPITPDNLRQVFDKWVSMVGCELGNVNETDYAVLFFADIMHDGERATMTNLPARLLHDENRPVFLLNGQTYDVSNENSYRNFWAIYDRPPETKHRHYLLERRDSLLPINERSFKGAFYTPLHIVDKAYDQLGAVLGKNWQKRYIIWDMCAGVGNLEVKHSNYRNVFMSTIDKADIDVMRASKTCVGANIFQYDYLNDDISDFGEIDYGLTEKVPMELRQAIADANAKKKGAKKILVLINPPYAEATSSDNAASKGANKSKKGVSVTKLALTGMEGYGAASNELFTQFVARIYQEMPLSKLAMFSTLKYINAQALETFRDVWKAKYLGGFVVHSKAFDGLKGDFPIGFLIWDTKKKDNIESVLADAIDKDGDVIGTKEIKRIDNAKLLTTWVERPKKNQKSVVPLKGAITAATVSKDLRGTFWSDNAIAWFNCAGNDLQQASKLTMILSSGFGSGRGFFVNEANLWQVAVMFAVRRLVKPTWLNDRDQFLQPSKSLPNAFTNDCLIWMLFSNSNLTAGADSIEWNDKSWSLVNHFIPFTEKEVNAKGRFQSDFMVRYLKQKKLSKEAKAVLNEGLKLWKQYHTTSFSRKIRDDLKLNRTDVGWYQIRKALEANQQNEMSDFKPFKDAYVKLGDKLHPKVFGLGFLAE